MQKAIPYAEIFYGGVIGELNPVEFESFTSQLSDLLGEPVRGYKNNQKPYIRSVWQQEEVIG